MCKKLWKWEIALMIGLAVALCWGAAVGPQQRIARQVVRLHIIANSDSAEDQALKLTVRDAVLERAETLLSSAADRSQAEGILRGRLLELEALAEETMEQAGYAYGAEASLTNMAFPTREYDTFALPAGDYLALRIVIGAGEGQNWWCVVFPPLCTASSVETEAVAAGLQEGDVALITGETAGYQLRFKTLEWIGLLKEKLG